MGAPQFWVCIASNGMPIEVQKCEFRPTILPHGGVEWIATMPPPTPKSKRELDREMLEAEIVGIMSLLRKRLDAWEKLR